MKQRGGPAHRNLGGQFERQGRGVLEACATIGRVKARLRKKQRFRAGRITLKGVAERRKVSLRKPNKCTVGHEGGWPEQ